MKNNFKNFLLAIFFFILFFGLIGCDFAKIKYNVKIINEYKIKEEFLEGHRIRNAYYMDPVTGEYILGDKNLPEEYEVLIRTEEEFQKIFSGKSNINFNKEVLVVYVYNSIYDREKIITDVEIDEGELSIEFKSKNKYGVGDSSLPLQRIVVFKMKIGNFYSVDIDED